MVETKLLIGLVGIVLGILMSIIKNISYMGYSFDYILIIGSIILIVRSKTSPGQKVNLKKLLDFKSYSNKKILLRSAIFILVGILLFAIGTIRWWGSIQFIGLVAIIYGIYQLIVNQNKSDILKEALYKEQDKETSRQMKNAQNQSNLLKLLYKGCLVVGACLFLAGVFVNSLIPVAIIVVVISIALELMIGDNRQKFKSNIVDTIIEEAYKEVFDVTEHQIKGIIPREYIYNANFGLPQFDDENGKNYISGFYHGLPIEMCDLYLFNTVINMNENSASIMNKHSETVFKGIWLTCDFGKEFPTDVRLWKQDSKLPNLTRFQNQTMDKEAFNKKFHVESETEFETYYILTPHIMESITKMQEKFNAKVHIRFEKNGKVHIAVNLGASTFETGSNKDATLLRTQFVQRLRCVTDFIDDLHSLDNCYRF